MPASNTAAYVARLTAILACAAMATARFGLVFHELVGHGGAAIALGGHIVSARLFWFAGGWIHYELPDSTTTGQLIISMGGIAIELVIGVGAWLVVRGDSFAARIVRACGAALVVHASWYFATGTWHGYGDGWLVYQLLGDMRYPAAIAGGVITCAAAFIGARQVFASIVHALPRRRAAGVAIALVLAGGVNAGLAAGELVVRRDTRYGAIMTSERDREIERDYARWLAQARTSGVAIDDAAKARELDQLQREHASFPFAVLLAIVVLGSAIVGAWLAVTSRDDVASRVAELSPRLVTTASITAIASIVIVVLLDLAV